jgi:hypothetical protein
MRAQVAHRWAQDELEGHRRRPHARRAAHGHRRARRDRLELVKIAAPFGFRISAIRRRAGEPTPEASSDVWPLDRLPDLLAAERRRRLALPHTPETKRLIGRELDRIKRGALLVNVARGKLVDDEAVIEALRDGRLGGAALDVFSQEPLEPSSPYWDLPNVIVTPHTSGAMQDYWTPLVALFSETCAGSKKASRCATSLIKWRVLTGAVDRAGGQVGRRSVGQVGGLVSRRSASLMAHGSRARSGFRCVGADAARPAAVRISDRRTSTRTIRRRSRRGCSTRTACSTKERARSGSRRSGR